MWAKYLLFLMLEQLLKVNVDMTMVVLAMEDRFATTIFATSNVELELSAIEDLVVAIERTEEHFGLLNL